MVFNKDSKHDIYLEQLIYNLDRIGEDKSNIEYVLVNPMWYEQPNSQNKMADLVLLNRDGIIKIIELKSNNHQRRKAVNQVDSTERYIEELDHYFHHRFTGLEKKIVYYGTGEYDYEVVPNKLY